MNNFEHSQVSPQLRNKLDNYGALAKSQVKRGKSGAELAGYAAAAGAALAMAGNAEATVIYSGIQNITAQIDPTVQFTPAIGSNGWNGYNVELKPFQIAGENFQVGAIFAAAIDNSIGANSNLGAKYIGGALVQGSNVKFLGSGGPLGLMAAVAPGALIGPGGSFGGAAAGAVKLAYGSISGQTMVYGNNFVGEGIFGFQLASGNYGWIRLLVEDLGDNQPFNDFLTNNSLTPFLDGKDFADRITVLDWAYDDQGSAIIAGTQIALPEPGALELLAAGAVGIAAMRRRQQRKTVH